MSRVPNGDAPKGAAAEMSGDDGELIAKVGELERIYTENSPEASRQRQERGEPAITDDESDEAGDALNRLHPEIASAPVHTLQGIAAKLRAMRWDLHEGTGGDYQETALATIMAALERIEVPAGIVPVSAEPDPAVDLAHRWINEMRAFSARKNKSDEEADAFERDVLRPIETAMLDTEPVTAEGVVATIAVALDLERDDKGDVEADAPYYDRFVFALMEKARRFEAERRRMPAEREPDAVPELVRKYIDARDRYLDSGGLPDDKIEAFDRDVWTPIEDELKAAIPTSREGVVAILDLACEMRTWDADPMSSLLVKNVRDAVKGGAS